MHSADERPLLFLDSGMGGLSIADAVRAHLPHHQQVYVADYAGFPYGTKTESEIVDRLPALLAQLAKAYKPTIITIACNTASTIALDAVRDIVDIPIVGTVPAIKPAAAISKSNIIGVLGTQATVRQPYVANLAQQFAPGADIIHYGAAGLVTLAEAKMREEIIDMGQLRSTITPMMDHPSFHAMDVLVLSCTHFPFLREELAELLPRGCQLIDGAQGIARRITTLLQRSNQLQRGPNITKRPDLFISTSDIKQLESYSLALKSRNFSQTAFFPFAP